MEGFVDDIPGTVLGNLRVENQCLSMCFMVSQSHHWYIQCSIAILLVY